MNTTIVQGTNLDRKLARQNTQHILNEIRIHNLHGNTTHTHILDYTHSTNTIHNLITHELNQHGITTNRDHNVLTLTW